MTRLCRLACGLFENSYLQEALHLLEEAATAVTQGGAAPEYGLEHSSQTLPWEQKGDRDNTDGQDETSPLRTELSQAL